MKFVQAVMNKMLPKNINYKKRFVISVILIIVGAFMSFFGVPQFVKIIVKYTTVLSPGHYVRNMQENKLRFTYKLYLWNVTNPNEIAAGTDKPKMQEIGPYVFS